MKKYVCLFTIAVLLILSQRSFAQLIADKGLKAGLSLSTFSTEARDFQDNSLKPGLVLGGYVAFNLFDSFYLQPEALFSMKGTKQNDPGYGGEGRLEEKFTLTYLDIPILAGFRIHRVHLLAGPYLGLYIANRVSSEYKGGPLDGEKDQRELRDDLFESNDLGLIFGAGYSLSKLYFEGRYVLGLGNVRSPNEDNIKLKNRVLQFMLGVSL